MPKKTPDLATLAGRATVARIDAGLKQRELAEKAGVQGMAISEIERGVVLSPKPETLARIAEATGRTVDWLVRGDVTRDSRVVPDDAPDLVPLAPAEMLEKALEDVPDRFRQRIRDYKRSRGPALTRATVHSLVDDLVAGYLAEEQRAAGVAFPKGGREPDALKFDE